MGCRFPVSAFDYTISLQEKCKGITVCTICTGCTIFCTHCTSSEPFSTNCIIPTLLYMLSTLLISHLLAI